MTEAYPIEFESEGFRKNNLDWRKFRDNYTRVSASKVERGIKPLPLSLLLKLFGPQKVFNTYVVSRRATSDLDYLSTVADHLTAAPHPLLASMSASGGESKDPRDKAAVTNTLVFPGDGFCSQPEESTKKSQHLPGKKTKGPGTKRDALPSRPAFQRGVHVPGRYFPKTTFNSEDLHLSQSVDLKSDRPRTRTPRSYIIQTPSSSGPPATDPRPGTKSQQSGFFNRGSSRVVKGSMCKATDTYSAQQSKRGVTYSAKSVATVRSMPGFSSTDFIRNGRSADMLYVNTRTNDRVDSSFGNLTSSESMNGSPGDSYLDYFNTKRLRLSTRQVSFPGKSSMDFSTVLQGRPKTLHRREYGECEQSANHTHARESRAKTHVGFVE